METAPTQTNKQAIPIKLTPINIKYNAILTNNPIRNRTETIGFLPIITKTPKRIEEMVSKTKDKALKPLRKASTIRYIGPIKTNKKKL